MFKRQRHNGSRLAATTAALCVGIGMAVGAAPAATAADTPDQLAMTAIDNIVAGNYEAVTTHFDPTLQKMLPAKGLGQAWSTYQQSFGAFQSHGDPEDSVRGDLTVVNVPLQMDRKPGQFRLTVHPDGTFAGLYFLKEGVPIP